MITPTVLAGSQHKYTPNKLPRKHPEVYEHFFKRRFTVHKTHRMVSRISDDQAHEQDNKIIKASEVLLGFLTVPFRG